MTIEKIRNQLMSGVWQGVAQSGVDLSTIPQEGQEKLVRSIADRVLVVMNSTLEEIVSQDAPEVQPGTQAEEKQDAARAGDENAETILWQGRPFLAMNESYVLTNERIKIIRGFLSRNIENYELVRIQDIDFKQNLGERMLGIGDIAISGHDASDPKVVLRDIHDPEAVYEIIRRAWMESRKRHGLQFREYM